jgi:hypothetical protein
MTALVSTALVLAGCAHSGSRQPSAHATTTMPPRGAIAQPTFGPSGTLGTSNDPRFGRTLKSVEALLASVSLPPNAVRADAAPVAELAENSNYPECGGLIDRLSYWSAAESVASSTAYFRSHAPGKLQLGRQGTTTYGRAHVAVTVLDFGDITPSGDGTQVQVELTPYRNGVAIRVDARAIWNGGAGCRSS